MMNTSLQEFSPSPQVLGREWRPFEDHLGTALATLERDLNLIVAKQVDTVLRRFCGATDGDDAMLQRQFGCQAVFIEIPLCALLR